MARKQYRTCLGLNGFGWAHVIYGMPYHFDQILKHPASLGFDGVELFGMPTPYPEKPRDQQALRKQVEGHGLHLVSIQSLPGGLGNGHPGSSYSVCRNDYVEYIRRTLDLAATLGCDHVGVWAGELFGTGPNRTCVGYMVETYRRCAELACAARIPLCLEAEPVQQVNTSRVWFTILKGVDSKYFRAICDFAHLNILSDRQPARLLRRLLPHIGHTHICDNDGKQTRHESRSSKHLALDKGLLDWRQLLTTLLDGGYTEWLDIDVWEHRNPFDACAKSKRALDVFLHGYQRK
jgi:sugar phosphate isomerase/epimerase